MTINEQNVFLQLEKFNSKIDEIINRAPDNFDYSECEDVVRLYLHISSVIVTMENVPENVLLFLSSDDNLNDIDIPEKYAAIKRIDDFNSFIELFYEDKIKKSLKYNDISKLTEYLVQAVKICIKNIELFKYVTDFYKENKMYKELIEIYKLMFIYSLNSVYFEKIGDMHYLLEDYNSALDSYLTCAESSDESVEIYKKLADVFEKINDNDSRLACLEHIKTIEEANGN